MNLVIGEILPLAVGIAISPIPIIAAILMLLSPRAKGTSVGFMIGWLAGIVVAIVLFSLLSSVSPPETGGRSPAAGVIKIILGVLLLVLAIKQWRTRPAKGNQASLPNGCRPSIPCPQSRRYGSDSCLRRRTRRICCWRSRRE